MSLFDESTDISLSVWRSDNRLGSPWIQRVLSLSSEWLWWEVCKGPLFLTLTHVPAFIKTHICAGL